VIGLETLLRIAVGAQIAPTAASFCLVQILGLKKDLAKLPLLAREVFQVHAWFIGITCAIFAAMTWRFAPEMAAGSNEAARWLAGSIGLFWGVRAILQAAYYSPSHWRGNRRRTLAHLLCLGGYGGLSLVYLHAAWGLFG